MGKPAYRSALPGLILLLLVHGCAARSVPIVVAQATLGTAQAVGTLQVTAEQLHRTGVLTTPQALAVQERLLSINQKILLVVPTLQAIDRLQQAGAPLSVKEIDEVLMVIVQISEELSLVVAGVPVAEPTRTLLDAVRAAQQATITTLLEIARLRAALEAR